jgi:hypothetical protein
MATVQLSKGGRCWWCGSKPEHALWSVEFQFGGKYYATQVCSAEHEQEVVNAYRSVQRRLPVFTGGLFTSVALILLSSVLRPPALFLWAGVLLMGLTLVCCPFVTPQTVEAFGLKRSFQIGRAIGVLFILAGLGFACALLLS